MKKLMGVFIICLLLLCMTACGSTNRSSANFGNIMEFTSNEEMLKYMDGMWVVDNNADDKTYYIFADNQIYITTDDNYSAQIKELLDSTLQNSGLDSLYIQDFESVSQRMCLSDITITPDPITLYPQNGEVKLYEGGYDEKSIIITEESVLLVPKNSENGIQMTKLSDTEDFTTEHFKSLFNQTLDNYQIPSSYFLMDTKKYGEAIKSTIPSFDWWSLVQSEGDLQAYKPNEALTSLKGSCLIITKESLTYLYKTSVSTGFIGQNHEELLSLIYNPEKGSCEITTVNKSNIDAHSLIAYGIYATQNIPGAYTDPAMLYNDMVAKGETKRTDYDTTITMKSNGLEYSLRISYTGVPADFSVQVDDTVFLKDVLNNMPTEEDRVPDNSTTPDNESPSNNGNNSNVGNTSQQPAACSHNYADATCTTPKTCTLCGVTSGSALGHKWKTATCTMPEYCTECNKTRGEALGHQMLFTKCENDSCNYVDYSCIADTYTNVSVDAYLVGTTTWVDVNVTNVSISHSGVLSFTFNEKNYNLTVKQNDKSQERMGYFNCYLDGVLIEDVDFRAGNQSYYNAIYLDRFIADGYRLYIYATR